MEFCGAACDQHNARSEHLAEWASVVRNCIGKAFRHKVAQRSKMENAAAAKFLLAASLSS